VQTPGVVRRILPHDEGQGFEVLVLVETLCAQPAGIV
jgi:hypothetical protein